MSTLPAAPEADLEVPPELHVVGTPEGLRPRTVLAFLVVFAGGFAIPALLADASMRFVVDAMIMGMYALSIGFLAGQVGLISIAHGAFYGGAGYAMAVALSSDLGIHAAAGLGLVVAVVLAVVVGAVSIRVPGIGFAIVTLGFGQVVYLIVTLNQLRPTFGGFDGRPVSASSFLWVDDLSSAGLWQLIWLAATATVVGLWFLKRSRFGTLLSAIKDNEERVRFSGFGTFAPRLAAFTLSGLVAGVAGVLAALDTNYVAPLDIYWIGTAFALIAALIGGTGTLLGPFIGAFLISYLQNRFATTGGTNFYLGMVFIFVVTFFPAGITGVTRGWWSRWRRRHRPSGGAA